MKTVLKLAHCIALATVLLAASAMADTISTTCPPDLVNDGIAVTPGCPGLTYRVIVEPSTFFVSANDNPISQGICLDGGTGDCDDNDIWANGMILVNANGTDEVFLTYGGHISALTNHLFLGSIEVDAAHPGPMDAGAFAPGTILPFSELTGQGIVYFSNPLLNPQGVNEFYMSQQANQRLTPSPELESVLSVGVGVFMLALFRKLRIGAGVLRSRLAQDWPLL